MGEGGIWWERVRDGWDGRGKDRKTRGRKGKGWDDRGREGRAGERQGMNKWYGISGGMEISYVISFVWWYGGLEW